MIHVEIVKPNRKDIKPFIQLPFDIYKADKNWAPPSRFALTEALVGKNNEFLSRGIQRMFLAYDNETPVARVLAGVDLRNMVRQGEPSGFISLFETFENYEYARAVLDAAVRFIKEHGAKQIYGPLAPQYDLLNRGVLVDGFDGPPVLENAYNTPAVPQILEKYGFVKWRDYLAYDIQTDKIPLDRILPMSQRIRDRIGFRVETNDFSKRNLIRVAQDLSTVISEATPEESNSYLPTTEDLLQLFKRIKPWLKNESAVMAYAGRRPIGAVGGFLDSSPSMLGTDGRRNPLNWLRRLVKSRQTRSARCPIQYVVPEYQNKSVNTVLPAEAVKGAKKLRIQRIEGSLVDETNVVSVNNTLSAGGKLYRRYRVYRLAI